MVSGRSGQTGANAVLLAEAVRRPEPGNVKVPFMVARNVEETAHKSRIVISTTVQVRENLIIIIIIIIIINRISIALCMMYKKITPERFKNIGLRKAF